MSGGVAAPERAPLRVLLGWLVFGALVAYTGMLHHGLGPPPGGFATKWWHPTQFLLGWESVGSWVDRPTFGVAMLTLPAAFLAAGVFLGARSAVLRSLALACVVTAGLFAFYGLAAQRPWEFFHWRASLVIIYTGLAIGCAAGAPLLAASWLRRHWLVATALYLPVFFAIIALVRNATGTDERLFFNFSPWPAVPIFGLEIGAYTIVGLLLGQSVAALAGSRWRESRWLCIAGIGLAACIPATWFYGRFAESGGSVLFAMIAAGIVGIPLALITSGGARRALLERRALHFALGAVLVAIPLLSGRAMATGDYAVNRFVRAETIIVSLQQYFDANEEYPDELEQLLEEGYLHEIPKPRVGFDVLYDIGWLDPIAFDYQSLGSSYVLEFVSTEWVQCAYNPPWADDDDGYDYEEGDDEELEDWEKDYELADDDDTGSAWSCPDERPELW